MKPQPVILPFFPLGVFLFPGEDLPLRIFEPRYIQLVEEARTTGITFVIPFLIQQEVQEFGCEVRLKEVVAENPGGRMVISVEALSIVQIVSFRKKLPGKLYAGGSIVRITCSQQVESHELKSLIKNYAEQFDKDFPGCQDLSAVTRQDVMKALNLSSEEKYKFVQMQEGEYMENYLAGQLRYLNMIRSQEADLGNDFGLN